MLMLNIYGEYENFNEDYLKTGILTGVIVLKKGDENEVKLVRGEGGTYFKGQKDVPLMFLDDCRLIKRRACDLTDILYIIYLEGYIHNPFDEMGNLLHTPIIGRPNLLMEHYNHEIAKANI